MCDDEEIRVVPRAKIYLEELCEDPSWHFPMQQALTNLHPCAITTARTWPKVDRPRSSTWPRLHKPSTSDVSGKRGNTPRHRWILTKYYRTFAKHVCSSATQTGTSPLESRLIHADSLNSMVRRNSFARAPLPDIWAKVSNPDSRSL